MPLALRWNFNWELSQIFSRCRNLHICSNSLASLSLCVCVSLTTLALVQGLYIRHTWYRKVTKIIKLSSYIYITVMSCAYDDHHATHIQHRLSWRAIWLLSALNFVAAAAAVVDVVVVVGVVVVVAAAVDLCVSSSSSSLTSYLLSLVH